VEIQQAVQAVWTPTVKHAVALPLARPFNLTNHKLGDRVALPATTDPRNAKKPNGVAS
jgi:hypothetical protein